MSTPRPRATLDVIIHEKHLTLGTLRHLVDKAVNFADSAEVTVFLNALRVVQESQQPVTGEELTGATTDPRDEFPRDSLGRFVKRKSHYSDYLTDD